MKDILLAASDLVEASPRLYKYGLDGNTDHCTCAAVAIEDSYALHYFAEFLGLNPPQHDPNGSLAFDLVVQWNDAPERTQAEVVSALRAAAEVAPS